MVTSFAAGKLITTLLHMLMCVLLDPLFMGFLCCNTQDSHVLGIRSSDMYMRCRASTSSATPSQ